MSKSMISLVGLFVLMGLAGVSAQEKDVQLVKPTRGEYLGHEWHIDRHHLPWWDGKPYVRYGFTGNGDIDTFMAMGFTQFNVSPSEELWVFSNDPDQNRQAIERVDAFTDELTRKGATYYAGLNLFWPWAGSGKIAEKDKVGCVFRRVWDVTELAGRDTTVELEFVSRAALEINEQSIEAYLFDFEAGKYEEISTGFKSVRTAEKTVQESPQESHVATVHVVTFKKMPLPDSNHLRIIILVKTATPMVPGIYPQSFPPLWKPAIQARYLQSLQQFQQAYRKEGLRGMLFGDEVDTHQMSMTHTQFYVDFREDLVALNAYRHWLKQRFESVERLNDALQAKYVDFKDVPWHISFYPFLENELERREDGQQQRLFGLYESMEQFKRIDRLQEEFRVWFYGYMLARYAKAAKETIGDVPVFVTSASVSGEAGRYLQIHKHALLEGVDGLVRNHYGWLGRDAQGRPATLVSGTDQPFPLATVTALLDEVQRECGLAKAYFANEFGHPQAEENGEFHDDFGLGGAFTFNSKEELREFLLIMIAHGYKGFNMFKMNPNVPTAQQEVQWFAELHAEIVEKIIATTAYRQSTRLDAEQAIAIAREHPQLERKLSKRSEPTAKASFNGRYNCWIVEFFHGDRQIAFVSVSPVGCVLEVEVP